jgi:hypothetical protein
MAVTTAAAYSGEHGHLKPVTVVITWVVNLVNNIHFTNRQGTGRKVYTNAQTTWNSWMQIAKKTWLHCGTKVSLSYCLVARICRQMYRHVNNFWTLSLGNFYVFFLSTIG